MVKRCAQRFSKHEELALAASVTVATAAEETLSASSPNTAKLIMLRSLRSQGRRERDKKIMLLEYGKSSVSKSYIKEFRQEESVGFDD
jgi:hypothetical protein